MKIRFLEVLEMDNGELLCGGKSLGFLDTKDGVEKKYLFEREACCEHLNFCQKKVRSENELQKK